MILRIVAVGLAIVLAAAVQTALVPLIPLGRVRLDLLLLIAVGIALRDGPVAGLRVGFAAGLVTDLLVTGAPVGIAALITGALGYLVGLLRPYLSPDSFTAPVLVALVTGLLGTAGYGVATVLLGDERVTLGLVAWAAGGVGLYNALVGPLVFAAVARLCERFPLSTGTTPTATARATS